ncbi:MAG: cytochrome c3 family protein, partial [Bacteroidota bacterium]
MSILIKIRKLSLSILLLSAFLLMSGRVVADSPHGKDFKLNCGLCHSSTGWKLDKSIYAFDHNKTAFPLTGQHEELDCKQCHPTLVFSEAKVGCVDCHTDMHNFTVGPDCGRCHTPKSWIVENITEVHQRSRFPLVGAHITADCYQCHPSASLLRFEPLGVECYDCHLADYVATNNPNHVQGGYSKNCIECHSINSFTWTGAGFNHSFFPLTKGHALVSCIECHPNGNYSNLSKECVSCHQTNYNNTTNPNHGALAIPTT